MTDVVKEFKGDPITLDFSGGTQDIHSAAIDEWIAASDVQLNPNGYPYADFEVALASVVFPAAADNAFELYLIPRVDGTNYPDYTGDGTVTEEQENNQLFIGSVTIRQGTSAARGVLRGVEVPAGPFKIGARNKTGIALAASANTVKLRYWAYKSA